MLLLLGSGVALFFFVKNFDPNQYRSVIEKTLSDTLQIEARMGDLSLGWQENGVGIQVKDVSLSRQKGMAPFFTTGSFLLKLNLLELFLGRITISEFALRGPEVLLIKQKDGSINWVTQLKKTSTVSSEKRKGEKMMGGLALLFSKATISDGNFVYKDETSSAPVEVAVKNVEAELRYYSGIIKSTGKGRILDEPERNLEWDTLWKMGNQELDFELKFRNQELNLKAKALPFQKPPRFQGTINLNHFVQDKGPLTGTVNGGGDWEGAGQSTEEIKKLLTGHGTVEIQDGAFRDVNLVRSVLARITIIPGLEDALLGAVPPEFQSLFNEKDTPFELLRIEFQIQDGIVTLSSFLLKSEHFMVEANGTVSLESDFNLQARLILMEPLSQYLMERVKELSYLTNEQKRIVIPFTYRGRWPATHPQPDLAYLGQQLIVDQGARLLEKGLRALTQYTGEKK